MSAVFLPQQRYCINYKKYFNIKTKDLNFTLFSMGYVIYYPFKNQNGGLTCPSEFYLALSLLKKYSLFFDTISCLQTRVVIISLFKVEKLPLGVELSSRNVRFSFFYFFD